MTTEIAFLLMYTVGVFLAVGSFVVPIVVTGATAILLQFKPELHQFAERLQEKDVRAIMRFVLVAAIILPILPDKTIGPFEVLNPFNIWRVVVLVVAINLTGYLLSRFIGQKAGTVIGGILGGVISSTATTFVEAKRNAKHPKASGAAATVIIIATTIMYLRMLSVIAVMAPDFLPEVALPIGIMTGCSIALSVTAFLLWRGGPKPASRAEEPDGLLPALVFAGLYALIGVGIAVADRHLGRQSLYWLAGLSGLTDVDAITLSTSQMVKTKGIEAAMGWRMILLAALSNLIFKTAVVAFAGNRALTVKVLLLFGVSLGAGVAILIFG